MRDDREMRNRQIKAPVSGWLDLVRTNFYYRGEGWLYLFHKSTKDIVLVSTDTEAKLVEEFGHAAVIIDDEVAAVVFATAVETLINEGYFIPPLLLLVESLESLTAPEKILYLSLAKLTPMELVLGERLGFSISDLIEVDCLKINDLIDSASRKVRGENPKNTEPYE